MNTESLSGLARLTRAALAAAGRRWPDDVAETMRREWTAELEAIRGDRSAIRPVRAYRMIAFAGSIALSPAVEEPDADPVGWRDRLTWPAAALGSTLLAGALFNAVHIADHRTGRWSLPALAAAVLLMTLIGHRFAESHPERLGRASTPARMTVAMGVVLFAFLMSGNQVAVMPFMGWVDVLPAVAVWTVLTAGAVALARRRRVLGFLAAALALATAAVAGSWHAAHVLKIGFSSAPAWFPLALLPGGTVRFGEYHPDGEAAYGSLQGTGPAFHASDILLGNMSAMAGPMLLCSAFVLALAVSPISAPLERSSGAEMGLTPLRVPFGVAGAAAVLVAGELIRRSVPHGDATVHRLIDNNNVFGFGFLADTPGRIALALLGGLLLAGLAPARPAT